MKLFRHGDWRAALRTGGGWLDVGGAAASYERGDLVEWGSVTKGVVATTARTLGLERPVRDAMGWGPDVPYAIGDLVRHTSGLPRLPPELPSGLFSDPYASTVGTTITERDAVPTGTVGAFEYSNLGYAVLGAALDAATGEWFRAVTAEVFAPAGIRTATLCPPACRRVLPRNWRGRTTEPWQLAGSPYAAAGGIWSTFADLCAYADWALADDARLDGWQQEDGLRWINGQTKSSGVCVAEHDGEVAVVHVLEKPLHSADRAAIRLLRDGVHQGGNGGGLHHVH